MGFIRGMITGVAVAAGFAAWYMSRSGAQIREQYKFEQRLGELGDQLETRTREIQGTVNSQIAEMRAKGQTAIEAAEAASTNGHGAGDALDDASASAAEAAAEVAAEADAITARVKRTTKDVAGNGAN